MHPYDRACEFVLQNNASADADEWIHDQAKGPRSIWEFDAKTSIEVVESVYARGANEVFVVGDEDVLAKYGSVDMLLIHLPMDGNARAALFDLEHKVAEETGFDESIDEGQRYILLRWT